MNQRVNWDAFWAGTLGRPMFIGNVARPGAAPAPWVNPYRFAFTDDVASLAREVRRWAESREWIGDAVPGYQVTFGPDHFAALLGAELKDGNETTWCEPFVKDWDEVELRFQTSGPWWERTVQTIRALRTEFAGKLIVFRPDLSGGLDCLTSVRGAGELMEDLATCPDKVRRALTQVDRAFDEVIAALDRELDVAATGTLNRFGMYCSRRINVSQCDASCMISRAMFGEFQMPSLRHEMAGHDVNCYHLDGPEAVPHVPSIAGLPNLHIIQWRPKHNGRWRENWPVYRQVDALGKGHVFQTFLQLTPPDIAELCGELRSPWKVFDLSHLPASQRVAVLAGVRPAH